MKNLIYKLSIFLLLVVLQTCSQDSKHTNSSLSNEQSESKIIDLADLPITDSIDVAISLASPFFLMERDSAIVVLEFFEGSVKYINLNGEGISFNPLGYGDNTQGGSYFRGAGISGVNPRWLYIQSESNIRSYDLDKGLFMDDFDSFNDCIGFNPVFSALHEFQISDSIVIVSQRSEPCLPGAQDSQPLTLADFSNLEFLRSSVGGGVTSFSIPEDNPILRQQEFHVKTFASMACNSSQSKCFVTINPTGYIYPVEFDESSGEIVAKSEKGLVLELPYSEQHVLHTHNQGIDRSRNADNFKYNFAIKLFAISDDYAFIYYRPSLTKDAEVSGYLDNRYLLSMVETGTGRLICTVAVDYTKHTFLGTFGTDKIWLYDVAQSENNLASVGSVLVAVSFEDLRSFSGVSQ